MARSPKARKAGPKKLTFTRSKWIDDATLEALCKRSRGTTEAPKDFEAFSPTVRPYNEAGTEVAVPLCGSHGRDREMLLDRADWEAVSTRYGARWFVAQKPKGGEFYVATMSDGSLIHLAHHLIEPPAGWFIMHKPLNVLDLRRASLKLISIDEMHRWNVRNVLPPRPRKAPEAPKGGAPAPEERQAGHGRRKGPDAPQEPTKPALSHLPDPTAAHGAYSGTVLHNGRLAVSVPLKGTLGQGKRMLLDDSMWERVRRVLGSEWHLSDRDGYTYVISPDHPSGRQPGAPPVTRLARYVAGARPDQVVTYLDRDPLNLMRGNLRCVGRGEFLEEFRVSMAA